jgi:hypothetical protein
LGFLDEPVGRLPTLFTNPGTLSSSTPKSKGGSKRRQNENKRAVRLRLLPNGSQERKLRRIADAAARLWNELNYTKLVQFRASGKVDFKGTGHEFYHRYKGKLGVNAGQVINLMAPGGHLKHYSGFTSKANYRGFTVSLRRQASGGIRCLGGGC